MKVLNLLFFTSFFWKWAETSEKLQSFAFGPKQCFYLTHWAREYFENCHLRNTKKETLNGCISKARTNSESKLTFSESSFNFLSNRVVFCTLYMAGGFAPYNPQCYCQRLAGLKELIIQCSIIFSKFEKCCSCFVFSY